MVSARVRAVVEQVLDYCVLLRVASTTVARVQLPDVPVTTSLAEQYHAGDWVDATFLRYDASRKTALLSLRDTVVTLAVGAEVVASPRFDAGGKYQEYARVDLEGGGEGALYCTEVCEREQWHKNPLAQLTRGEQLHARVVGTVEQKGKKLWMVSCRAQPEMAAPAVGELVYGFIVHVGKKLLVRWVCGSAVMGRLSSDFKGFVALRDAADKFIKDPAKVFHPGQFVTGRVLSVNAEHRCCDLSLRVGVGAWAEA